MTRSGDIRTRLGVDIGGTFTDIVVFGSNGAVHTRKLSSTIEDYSRGIAEGLQALFAEAGLSHGAAEEVIHGTTAVSYTHLTLPTNREV